MAVFLWIGTSLGLIVGICHASQVFLQRIAQGTGALMASYYAAWTLVLWSLFGAYVLAFWILGSIGLAASRLVRRDHPST